jgi:hypothetical protein
MAVRFAVDSKTQYVAVATHRDLLVLADAAAEYLPSSRKRWTRKRRTPRLRGKPNMDHSCTPATEEDWKTGYLVTFYPSKSSGPWTMRGSHQRIRLAPHRRDRDLFREKALRFMDRVDSADVSGTLTRFRRRLPLGLGGEVGISTGKLHAGGLWARGSSSIMGLFGPARAWLILGPNEKPYTHRTCPMRNFKKPKGSSSRSDEPPFEEHSVDRVTSGPGRTDRRTRKAGRKVLVSPPARSAWAR